MRKSASFGLLTLLPLVSCSDSKNPYSETNKPRTEIPLIAEGNYSPRIRRYIYISADVNNSKIPGEDIIFTPFPEEIKFDLSSQTGLLDAFRYVLLRLPGEEIQQFIQIVTGTNARFEEDDFPNNFYFSVPKGDFNQSLLENILTIPYKVELGSQRFNLYGEKEQYFETGNRSYGFIVPEEICFRFNPSLFRFDAEDKKTIEQYLARIKTKN